MFSFGQWSHRLIKTNDKNISKHIYDIRGIKQKQVSAKLPLTNKKRLVYD
jgi:hypothetical protein